MSSLLFRGKFGPACIHCIRRATGTKPSRSRNLQLVSYRQLHIRTFRMPLLYTPTAPVYNHGLLSVRQYGTRFVLKTVRSLTKLRYLVLTTAVGGGVALQKTYQSWYDKLPDMSWVNDYIPDPDKLEQYKRQAKGVIRSISIPELTTKDGRRVQLPTWESFTDWLDNLTDEDALFTEVPDAGGSQNISMSFFREGAASESEQRTKERDRIEELQEELMQIQVRLQREIEGLEKDNRELKKQLLLKDQKRGQHRKMKRSLIDMYSEVLDELHDYDSSYNTQDHLPRVVVIGDQSAGKTSVLEMIAKARIFPRGSGEMMTRAPVKVTLSEGPYHVASFKDSTREFDLTKESELEALRKEVEIRMKASVNKGQTVSGETISMTVKGPSIKRMVLVDLPGIISTQTTGMASDTKETIQRICKHHMQNPNAIILCIQDGSLDAERSNVTNLVSDVDPLGKRTIFVLTKVDIAESSLYNPERIKQILAGKLFPMKALGYFAVVTGRGNTSDSISDIKQYEEDFFRESKLFRDGVLKSSQMTTHNLSSAVSECFWKMVSESVEQQADAFKATRFNLETEWKNTFPRVRELDKEELFEKARGEILDEIVNLSQITPKEWEEAFSRKLWSNMANYVFENIYLPASQTENVGTFNTAVDIKLKQWADKMLPKKCVKIGRETLEEQFSKLLESYKSKKDHDEIFDNLKAEVRQQSMRRHKWEEKAEESLRVIQINTLEDRSVHDKQQWDSALKFMENTVNEKLVETERTLDEMYGPGTQEQWTRWRYKTPEQKHRCAVGRELEKLLQADAKHKPSMSLDEVTTVRKNLETQSIDVSNEFIKETWYQLYRQHFLKHSLQISSECKKGFYYYQSGFTDSGMDCHDVVLFWRIQRMLQVTANALRQQVMNNEARRLEKNIKEVLSEFTDDRNQLSQLLTGRRVELAEELKRVRQIQELLEEFVEALNKEK